MDRVGGSTGSAGVSGKPLSSCKVETDSEAVLSCRKAESESENCSDKYLIRVQHMQFGKYVQS